MENEYERLASFNNWPVTAKQTPADLAREGFYHSGCDDSCTCAFCHVRLRNWKYDDIPICEHLRWSPDCQRAKRMSTKNVPIFPSLQSLAAHTVEQACFTTPTVENTGLPSTLISFIDEISYDKRRVDALKCKKCKTQTISTLFLPCNHSAVCRECCTTTITCPYCHSKVKQTIHTRVVSCTNPF